MKEEYYSKTKQIYSIRTICIPRIRNKLLTIGSFDNLIKVTNINIQLKATKH